MREPRLCAKCESAYAECPQCACCLKCCGCEYEMRSRAAIAQKATIAVQIACSEGDAEVKAKHGQLNDSALFWAYIAAERPVYAFRTCVEFERSTSRQGK